MSHREYLAGIFSADGRFQRWLEVERALAKVEGKLGVIPEEAAEAICGIETIRQLPMERYPEKRKTVYHILVAFIRLMEDALGKPNSEFLHYGSTTQDVCDTAMMLGLKQLRDEMLKSFHVLLADFIKIAEEHRDTLVIARTNGIQAIPITFGFKVAQWIAEMERDIDRLERLDNIFVMQFAGTVGTMAALGEKAYEIQQGMAKELGLGIADICWQSGRDRMCEIASTFAICTNTLGRIAQDVYRGMQTEVSELCEPIKKGVVGSSTMPHKFNPHRSQRIMYDARAVRFRMAEIFEATIVDYERNTSYCTDEMYAFDEIAVLVGEILDEAEWIFGALDVKKDNMEKNLNLLGGIVLSEKLMVTLGEKIGKQTAHGLVQEDAYYAMENGIPFKEILKADQRVTTYLPDEEIDRLLDPREYIGRSKEIADQIIAKAKKTAQLGKAEI